MNQEAKSDAVMSGAVSYIMTKIRNNKDVIFEPGELYYLISALMLTESLAQGKKVDLYDLTDHAREKIEFAIALTSERADMSPTSFIDKYFQDMSEHVQERYYA